MCNWGQIFILGGLKGGKQKWRQWTESKKKQQLIEFKKIMNYFCIIYKFFVRIKLDKVILQYRKVIDLQNVVLCNILMHEVFQLSENIFLVNSINFILIKKPFIFIKDRDQFKGQEKIVVAWFDCI
eukprot:TRINITY_DN33574_c0_g1_i1.p2 TRINITY_DN33574_c0_g1~~TRINITY_DN33574_c0_g1_i1.p2  ORF type:complete len:126 (-),score=4.77 TRINITY_DN33574_c0_g1_i1:786-1163(-)